MSSRDLPLGWAWMELGEACEVSPRDPALPQEAPFVPMGSVEVGRKHPVSYEDRGKRGGIRAQGSDVLFARITPCLENGKVALLPSDVAPTGGSTEFIVIRPSDEVSADYLYYWCLHPEVRVGAEARMSGATGRMRLSGKDLAQFKFPLPPLAEQHRIVDALEDHLSRLDAADSMLRRSESRLRTLVEGSVDYSHYLGVVGGNTAPPPVLADVVDGDLPPIPATWTWHRLGELAEVAGGLTKDAKKQSDPDLPLHPYLRVANVQAGYLDLDHVTEIRATPAQVEKLTLRRGDVLLNEGGDRDKLGRGWIWEDQVPACLHQNHVFRARVRDEVIDPRLIAWHANSFGRDWFIRNGKQSVNLASVSLRTIRAFPVPVPPRNVQLEIVERIADDLTRYRLATSDIETALARSQTLRQALLRAAFAGELVDQDSIYEPKGERPRHGREQDAASSTR